VQLIARFLDALPAELPEAMAIVLGLLAFALTLWAVQARRGRGAPVEQAASPQPKATEKPLSKAELAVQELGRAPDLQTLQARAAEQIDAAEHALNRLLADCAGIANLPVEPTLTPERQLKAEPSAPAQQSLAA
jgi:hypothetical protein